MKELLKKIIPNKFLKIYREKNKKRILRNAYMHDYNKFFSSIPKENDVKNIDQIEASLMFHSHSLEKGFSHADFRENFGSRALKELSKSITDFLELNVSRDNERFNVALSSVKNYILIHKKRNIEPVLIKKYFSEDVLKLIMGADETFSGIRNINKDDKVNNKDLNYKLLSENRVSIREYSDKNIDDEYIQKAVEMSMVTPSVCNRQPSRVIAIKNNEKIKEVLKIQGGYNGYSTPPLLLLVTTDNYSFVEINERNQGFIDGGLFSMSLLNSLEYLGLGACALNAMLSIEQENQIKRILDISNSQNLIMFVSVGHLLEQCKVPKSLRDDYHKVLRIVK